MTDNPAVESGARPAEIIFEVTEAVEGGYDARALGYSIYTQGESWRHYGYRVARSRGSHMTVTLTAGGEQHQVTVPRHRNVRVGTLDAIVADGGIPRPAQAGSTGDSLWLMRWPPNSSRIKRTRTPVSSRWGTCRRIGRSGSWGASLPEQAAIVRFLDHADRHIRRYIRAKQKLTGAASRANEDGSLIGEYRTRLIADVVTGKGDVRDIAAELPETERLAAERPLTEA